MEEDIEKTKSLIEGIIEDLSHNIPITKVFNKVQILANYLQNDVFSAWVKNERMGYDGVEQLPEYRKTNVDILVDGISGKYSLTKYPIPIGALGNDSFEKTIRTYNCFEKISNLEPFVEKPEGVSLIVLPAMVYRKIEKLFLYGEVHVAYHRVPNLFFAGVVDSVNARLLDFLLNINKEMKMDVDFNMINKKQYIDMIANQTINAGVINIGSGNVAIDNSQVMGGNNSMPIPSDLKEQILKITEDIEKIKVDDDADKEDIANEIIAIRDELNKDNASSSVIKRAFRVLKSYGNIVQEKIIEHGIEQIIASLSS